MVETLGQRKHFSPLAILSLIIQSQYTDSFLREHHHSYIVLDLRRSYEHYKNKTLSIDII